jgi:hypothetical protein
MCRLHLPLPEPDDHGRRVILMRIGVHNPDEVRTVDIFKVNMMIMDILLEEDDRSVICGIVLIIDHFNTTLKHMVQYSPSFAKKTITLLQVRMSVCLSQPSLKYPFTSSFISAKHRLEETAISDS